MDMQNIEARENWLIPSWIKITITFFALSAGLVSALALLGGQKTLFGVPTEAVALFSFALTLVFSGVAIVFWFFPRHALTVFLYWLIRFFRAEICVVALFGIVALFAFHIPMFSVRGGMPFLLFLLLLCIGLSVEPVEPGQLPFTWMEKFSIWWGRRIDQINSIPTSVLSIIVALLPILTVWSFIYIWLGARFSHYGPYSFWNDETGYWIWIRAFSQVGFNVGYNAPNELLAQAVFNHYGEGSPFYIYIYGGIARFLGWSPVLPIFINFAFLAIAILLFIRLTKLQPVQIIFVGLITILTWPILLYLPMTTQETLNQAIGFLLTILFFRLLTRREQLSLPIRLSFVILVFLAALIRLSWGLLLIPVLFYALNGSVLRRVLFSVLLGAGLYVLALMITSYLVPPTNNSIFRMLRGSLTTGPQIFIEYISFQFEQLLRLRQLTPNIAVMLQILIIFGWNLVRLVRMIRSKVSLHSILQSEVIFEMYNVASLAAAGLLFYIQEGFYRTFAPTLLVVYLLQAAKKDYRPLVSLLIINLIFFSSYMNFYGGIGDAGIIKTDYTTTVEEGPQLHAELEKWLVFDRTTQNPWCNTLLIPLNFYDSRLTLVPAGIGISYVLNIDTIQTPLKSKYLLLDQKTYDAFANRLDALPLTSLSIGDLYYNQDSGCELSQ